MQTIKFQLLILFLICFSHNATLAQKSTSGRQLKEEYYYYSIDTLKFKSPELEIVYNLERKMGLKDKVFKSGDSIFNSDFNTFSILRLINSHTAKAIDIPTIPIDDVIIDDSLGLILCLSRAMVSPYQMVLYDFDGNLLYKKKISSFELKMDSLNFKQFKAQFPVFYKYANDKKEIEFLDDIFYINLSYWHKLSKEEQGLIQKKGWFKFSHIFPYMTSESTASLPSYMLKNYQNFYSQTDPFYEYKVNQDNTLKSVILNNEYGGKVEIPVSKGIKVKNKE